MKKHSNNEVSIVEALKRMNSTDKTQKLSLRKAAELFKVPKSTLSDRYKKDNLGFHGSGSTTYLSTVTENLLVEMLIVFGDWGYGVTFTDMQSIILNYLRQTNQINLFKNGKPSKGWWYKFLNRHKQLLTLRLAGNICSNRAASCTKEIIGKFFDNCRLLYDELIIDLSKSAFVWNCDETGFSGDQGSQLVLCRRGSKRPLKLCGNNEKINYTVNTCCNANGQYTPLFIVYKASKKLMSTWTTDGPKDAVYTISPSGWMEKEQFIQWLKKVFVPTIKQIGGEHILILDGHNSHVTLETIETCKSNNIRLLCLPAHSSHILQPLDVGVFVHVKNSWRKVLADYYLTSGCKNIDKSIFPSLINKVIQSHEAFTRTHAITGFQKTGLFPLDITSIDETKLTIAETFEEPTTSTSTQAITSTATQAITSTALQTITFTPTIEKPNSLFEHQKALIEYSAASLEKAMKSFFQLQNKTTNNGKPKRVNVNLNGECLTNDEVIERVKRQEEQRALKKTSKRKLNFDETIAQSQLDPQSQSQSQTETKSKKQKIVKCKKCKKEFHDKMLACESCSSWLCIDTCVPKRYNKTNDSTEFYCTKKCRPL